jgi:hypothetical protein
LLSIVPHLHDLCPGGGELGNLGGEVFLHDCATAGGNRNAFGGEAGFGVR